MATSTSKTLIPEPFTGSNHIESDITHLELLERLRKWGKSETHDGNEVEINEHNFALRLVKSASDFYCSLTDAQEASFDETIQDFRTQCTEKSVDFGGRLARKMQHAEDKLRDILEGSQCLAIKFYPEGET